MGEYRIGIESDATPADATSAGTGRGVAMTMAMIILLVLLLICLSQSQGQVAQSVQQPPRKRGKGDGDTEGHRGDVGGPIVQAWTGWSWSLSWSWWNFQQTSLSVEEAKEGIRTRLVSDNDHGQARTTTAGSDHPVSDSCRSARPTALGGISDAGRGKTRRSVLLLSGRESDSQEVRVSDEQSLVNAMNMALSDKNAPSLVKIVIEKNILLQDRSLNYTYEGPRYVNRDANLSIVGDCGEYVRCILDARNISLGGDSDNISWKFDHNNGRGSLAMYNLEFRNTNFNFRYSSVELYNCVIRRGQVDFNYFLWDDTPNVSKRVVIDGCFIIENEKGVLLYNFPGQTCISRSVFVSKRSSSAYALSIVSGLALTEKKLTIINCTFGNSSVNDGFNRGAVKLIAAAFSGFNTGKLVNTTISFIDCTFREDAPSDSGVGSGSGVPYFVTVSLDLAGWSSEQQFTFPFWIIKFCTVLAESPSFRRDSPGFDRSGIFVDGSVPPNRSLDQGPGKAMEFQQCSSKTMTRSGREWTELLIGWQRYIRPYFETFVDNKGCGECGQSTVCNHSGPVFPLDGPLDALDPNRTAARSSRVAIAIAIATPIALTILVASLVGVVLVRRWRHWYESGIQRLESGPQRLDNLPEEEVHHLRVFTLKDLTEATSNFSTIIGQGGTAVVYKATLRNGEVVAVKSLKAEYWRSGEDFLHEVRSLGRIAHRNLVLLLGFCCQEKQYFLVYEFVPNGTLKNHLHRKPALSESDLPGSDLSVVLDWPTRVRIAHGVARALEYLHHLLSPPLVHRDIKPENILLLDDFTPKVADFGLCRAFEPEEDTLSTKPAGTRGYMAPEIYSGKNLTEKVDVYSYGILLLEIITGRRPFAKDFSLIEWVKSIELGNEGSEKGFADPKLQGNFNSSQLNSMTVLARLCIRRRYEHRPSMQNIVRELDIIQGGGDSIELGSTEYQTERTECISRLYIPRGERHRAGDDAHNDDDDDDDDYDDDRIGSSAPLQRQPTRSEFDADVDGAVIIVSTFSTRNVQAR